MRFTAGLIAFTAAIASVAAEPVDGTTTLTSTMTQTKTLTQCGPEIPDCPARTTSTTSSSIVTPTTTSTTSSTSIYTPPTTSVNTTTSTTTTSSSSKWSAPLNTTTAGPTATHTSYTIPATTEVPEGPSVVPEPTGAPGEGAAGNLVANTGALVIAVAAAIAAVY